jgi:cytochrome c-type biogenesis protein
MHSISQFLSETLSIHPGGISPGQALLALLIAYVGGILSSLTPCVYPMIPITVGVVGGIGTEKKSWHDVYLRGLVYVGGMTVVYSFLGVLAGLTGRVFGSFTNSSYWYLGLGILISIAALVMLEVLPFDPVFWWAQIKGKIFSHQKSQTQTQLSTQKELTLLGVFALGASSGFIAAPCTTPVLTSILAFIAKTQSVGLGLSLMIAFSLGLGTLLLVIAGFTGALQILPRSGKWMKTVKILSGLILLAFADYLIYRAGNYGGP